MNYRIRDGFSKGKDCLHPIDATALISISQLPIFYFDLSCSGEFPF